MPRGLLDWKRNNARILGRRRWTARALWTLGGMICIAAIADHAGLFSRLGGYPGEDQRLDGHTFTITRCLAGDQVELDGTIPLRLTGVGWDRSGQSYLQQHIGRKAMLKFDPARTRDNQRRLVAYLYEGDDCLNVEIIRAGAAYADGSLSPALLGSLKSAEAEARRKKLGRWKDWR